MQRCRRTSLYTMLYLFHCGGSGSYYLYKMQGCRIFHVALKFPQLFLDLYSIIGISESTSLSVAASRFYLGLLFVSEKSCWPSESNPIHMAGHVQSFWETNLAEQHVPILSWLAGVCWSSLYFWNSPECEWNQEQDKQHSRSKFMFFLFII